MENANARRVGVRSIAWLDVDDEIMFGWDNLLFLWLGIAFRLLASGRDHLVEKRPCSVASTLRQLSRSVQISGGDLALDQCVQVVGVQATVGPLR